jgi:hypothetical protein
MGASSCMIEVEKLAPMGCPYRFHKTGRITIPCTTP